MQSNPARAGVLTALVAAAVVLFVVLSGSDSDSNGDEGGTEGAATAPATTSAEPRIEQVGMRNGAPVGGVQELEYARGDRIRIRVRLDEQQEDVHIHGYEEEILEPGPGTITFDFQARLDGAFELEAHGADGDVLLAEIVVNPG